MRGCLHRQPFLCFFDNRINVGERNKRITRLYEPCITFDIINIGQAS